MSAEVTDADRATAEQIAVDLPGLDFDDNGQSWAEHVSFLAQALADQRAAADNGLRARVVELLDDEDTAVEMDPGWTISIFVPAAAGQARHEEMFDALGDLAYERQPEKRAWDIFVSSTRDQRTVPVHHLRAALDPPTAAPCTARHTVTGDGGVPAQWSCLVLGEHDEHQDSTGRVWA